MSIRIKKFLTFFSQGPLILIFVITFATNTMAKSNKTQSHESKTIIKCLVEEEFGVYALKFRGPLYQLNQKLLNEFTTQSDLNLTPKALNKICHDKEFSTSVKLVESIILHGKNIFALNKKSKFHYYHINFIEGLRLRSLDLFFDYLSHLQGLTASAGCIGRTISSYNEFKDTYQYLQDELGHKRMIDTSKEHVVKILDRLKELNSIMETCEKKPEKVAQKKKKPARK